MRAANNDDAVSRPLHAYERFAFVDGRRPWNVVFAVRRSGPLDEPDIRRALAGLQRRHPMLRVGIDPANRPAFVPTTAPIPLRTVGHAHDAAWPDELQSELERPFPLDGPLARLVWLPVGTHSDLILVTHHCICDGHSQALLIRQLLDGLDRPDDATAALTKLPSFDDLFPTPTSAAARRAIGRRATFARLSIDIASTVARRRPIQPQRPSEMTVWTIEPETHDTLSERCRQENVTLYTAVATALLRAFRAELPDRSVDRLLCPLGMRRLVPTVRPDMLFPFAAYVLLSAPRRLDNDFWSQTRRVRADLSSRRARLDVAGTIIAAERISDRFGRLIDLQLRGRPRNDLAFSHLGELDLPANAAFLRWGAATPWPEAPGIFSCLHAGRMLLLMITREPILSRRSAGRIFAHAASLLASEARTPQTSFKEQQ